MQYTCGELTISKATIINLLSKFLNGKYTTFDFIEKHMGTKTRNKRISPDKSWNASFGCILKQFEKDTNGSIISQIEENKRIKIDEGYTSTSVWKIKR